MCGIIGVAGSLDPARLLVERLFLLEYRGYDSAGIAVVDAKLGELVRLRAAEHAGSLAHLSALLDSLEVGPGPGIGHTRWATHGAPTTENAHPHLDCTGTLAIVHNGIIENHRELAAGVVSRGHRLSSETDSEVVAHLLEEQVGAGMSLAGAMRALLETLRGAFALAAVHVGSPEVVVAARRGSPLVVGRADGVGLVASDVAALISSTRELFELGDDEVVQLWPDRFEVLDRLGRTVEPRRLELSWSMDSARKGGFADFMSKEMHEQPRAVAETILGRVFSSGSTALEELAISDAELAEVRRVLIVACGSSYHAALAGRHAIESWARLPVEVDIASELRYRRAILDPSILVVAISQSGETADTFQALREARRLGARAVTLTNVVGSLMARESDGVLYTRAGPEIGVASTKCHLSQLALLWCVALHLANLRGTLGGAEAARIARAIIGLPDAIEATLERSAEHQRVAERFSSVRDFYFLGRHVGLPVALEGALKLKELAYVRAEGYPAGEMKHGPISLIERGAVVVVVATRSSLWEKLMGNVEEMRARGATMIAVSDEGDAETASLVDAVLEVPVVDEICSPAVTVVPLQRFAYAIARAKGHDVDRPRNLAKVVTVE